MTVIRHPLCAFRIAGAAVARACLAFIGFWNIPALGAIETPETQSARVTYHI
jgi:hypothetical protein